MEEVAAKRPELVTMADATDLIRHILRRKRAAS
jgi:hypothetical protein